MPSAPRPQSFSTQRRIRGAKANEFSVISEFKLGYRNREDITNLPANVLIAGSQNVLTNVSGRIGNRKGYALDGPADTSLSSVLSSYDYEVSAGGIRNLRAGSLTSAGNNGKLQYRYVDSSGVVTWRDLETIQTSINYNFTRWWDSPNNMSLMLYVNGAPNIREWSGGITTFASATSNSLTNQGALTWAQEGFYTTGVHTVVIAGVAYGATGGWGTHTLTGVAPDPTGGSYAAGTPIHQKPETNTNSSMSLALAENDLIEQLNNHVYVGDLKNNVVYISTDTDFEVFTFTSPTRLPGEGAILTLNAPPKALIPQENVMYVSSGLSNWGEAIFTLSADNTKEDVSYQELNTVPLQGAQSQAMTGKIRNNVLFVSNEPIVTTWGRVSTIYPVPQTTDFSSPIINDMNDYDFTNASVKWHKNFIYVAVPAEGKVLMFNMTDPKDHYWEAPQILPVSRFYVVDGDLYGHSYSSTESYKLFTGYNDNGHSMNATAMFAFDSYKMRPTSKGFNQYYVEGYISSNTTLSLGLQYDLDGCATNYSSDILGTDRQIVCISVNDNSLGKFPLGKQPLGTNLNPVSALPPKFRAVKTMLQIPFYEYSPSFTSTGVDQQWEMICFGPSQSPTSESNNAITQ